MTHDTKRAILAEVAAYYSDKLAKHGQTAQGVDWNSGESQSLRFAQLCKVADSRESFSINDVGCGYGALYDFLADTYSDFSYFGVDVSVEMVNAAIESHRDFEHAHFAVASRPTQNCDYGVASGIFNVRLGRCETEWRSHVESTLDMLNETSHKGFAFNCLTSYSDEDKMRDYLYYTDPAWAFDLCKRRYSRHVALLHDYGLYEFTILVRK